MKKYKFIIIPILAVIIYSFIKCNQTPTKELSATELKQKQQSDSIALVKDNREKQIDIALTTLKELAKKQMNDPSSFKLLDRTYDSKDSVNNVVKLAIKFSGTNKLGGVLTNIALGEVDLKTEQVILKEIK